MDGMTTWNASAARPPCVAGSVRGPMTLAYSSIELGQPFNNRSGLAPGTLDRWWMK
jgi:hypothetical protein